MPEDDPVRRARLEQLGLEPTVFAAIALAAADKARDGDLSAAKFLRDAAGSFAEGAPSQTDLLPDFATLTEQQLRALAAGEPCEP